MFAVLTATAVPEHLHGYISRFLSRVDVGVYVGAVTPRVIDELWGAVTRTLKTGSATLTTSKPAHEHGYDIKVHQTRTTCVRAFDGLPLIVTLIDNRDGQPDTVRPPIAP